MDDVNKYQRVRFVQGRAFDKKGREIIYPSTEKGYSAEFVYRPPNYPGCIVQDATIKKENDNAEV